jgi:thiol-disulfide isomerase/thioredoxin
MKVQEIKYIFLFVLVFISFSTINAQEDKLQKEITTKLNEIHKPTFKTRDSLTKIYKIISEKINYTSDTIIRNNLFDKIYQLNVLSYKNDSKELDNEFAFISQFPSAKISLDILNYKVAKQEVIEKFENFNASFGLLSFDLQNTPKGQQLKKQLVNLKNSSVGSKAPNFVVKEIRNTLVNLASYKDKKYVLLSYGNTTSKSCLDENIFLKEIFQKYNDTGLEIINIIIDDNMEVIRKGINIQKIEKFKNVPLILNDDSLLENYFVYSIPQKILIDKNGIIINRWSGANKIIKKEINLVLDGIFLNFKISDSEE